MSGMATVKMRGGGKKHRNFLSFALLGVILLAGCGGNEVAPVSTDQRETRVEWLGNQCFRITSSIGTSILTDPFSSGAGGRTLPSPLKPDIILISHESSDANNSDAADNQPTVFRGSIGIGANNATGIRIHGIPTFRDPDKETPDGMNIVFVWQMDGMRFCFLGSLLHQLSSAQVSQIGPVDVLFVPVGGSLSPTARQTVLEQLRPRLVIPMGRGAGGWTYGSVIHAAGDSARLSRSALPLQTTTLLL